MKQNIFIDTDICDDIDDLWALILALNVSQFHIIGISLAMGNTLEKAQFMAKLLSDLGRTDIPLFVGAQTDDRPNFHEAYYHDFNLTNYQGKIYDGLDHTEDLFCQYQQITILSLAPMRNVQTMFEQNKDLSSKASVIVMGGALRRGYLFEERPGPEYNILMDLKAAKYVFKHAKNCILAPLDVCREFIIKGRNYDRIKTSHKQDLSILIENYKLWDKTYEGGAIKFDVNTSSTILYDVVPIVYLLHPDYFKR